MTKTKKDVSTRVDTTGNAASSRTASTDANGSEQKAVAPGEPIEKALAQSVDKLSRELTHNRAKAVIDAIYKGRHGNRRDLGPFALYPFTPEDDALMLGFGLQAAVIERGACMAIVRQLVDAETSERIAQALAQRGPMQQVFAFRYEYNPDGPQWTELAVAK